MLSGYSAGKTKTVLKRLFKIALGVAVSLVVLFFVASTIWRFTGSNQWEYLGQKNGVKAYSLKMPGSDVRQVKGVMRVHATLGELVKLMQDPDICNDLGCTDSRTFEYVEEKLQYDYFRMPLPFPFKTREFVVMTQFYRNPRNDEVFLEVSAAPEKMPPNSCCFRVTEMNNTLRFTPLGNGEVELEYIIKSNEGGIVPDLYFNLLRPQVMFYMLPKIQEFVKRPKYQNAKFDFVEEK
jgi:hypothetical protein